MTEYLSAHWWTIITAVYVGGFLVVAFWEMAAPRRVWTVPTTVRWTNNFAIYLASASLTYLLLPTLSVGLALIVDENEWGLINVLGLSGVWVTVLGIIILDFAQYLEHRMVHRIPLLWRCHRMHHTDLDYDLTTGFRFHPIEGLVSLSWRMAVITSLGIPFVSVLVAELLLVVMNYFVHGNVRLPLALDRTLRRFIITPDLHRVHHSIDKEESDSNFGSILPLWDRLLGTYRDQPRAGHENMIVGIEGRRDDREMHLLWMLADPFLTPNKAESEKEVRS